METEGGDIIYVTGFGPFGEHCVNASWEVVQLLESAEPLSKLPCKLQIEQLRVEYDHVHEIINQRWRDLRPCLTVHVGVSAKTDRILLEQCAHNALYTREDIIGSVPSGCCARIDHSTDKQLHTKLDLERARRACHLSVGISCDVGEFLCGYSYYQSLCVDAGRALFVHVPVAAKDPPASQDTALALAEIIADLYQQVRGS